MLDARGDTVFIIRQLGLETANLRFEEVDFFCHAPFHILEGFHDLAMLHTYIHKQKTQLTESTHSARDVSLRTCFENFTRSPTTYPKI